jgi:hypothetical protein
LFGLIQTQAVLVGAEKVLQFKILINNKK